VGVFDGWEACEAHIKGFSGARFKGFFSQEAAEEWLAEYLDTEGAINGEGACEKLGGFGADAGLWSPMPSAPIHRHRSDKLLESNVTVLVFTSPIRSEPSLGLLQSTLGSFSYAPGLEACRLIVVCDGWRGKSEQSTLTMSHGAHQGKHSVEHARAYRDRIAALQHAIQQRQTTLNERTCNDAGSGYVGKCEWVQPHWEILRLAHWHGYGAALRAGLELV
jgi:hypothetical protein